MTQATTESKRRSRIIKRERPIIERPRLIKKLDECEARTILLLAPAGYGKTTLARQWAKTLSRVIWVSLTSAHRDVTVLARDLARSIEGLGDEGFVAFMEQYLKARQNPQKEAREIGIVLADALTRIRLPWLVLDDYHELREVSEAQALVKALQTHTASRFIVATRIRPTWADHRERLYGDVLEIDQTDLAMDPAESLAVVGRRDTGTTELLAMAQGWPAVLGLAAQLELHQVPPGSVPEMLHGFLAEELFASMPDDLQESLTQLALVPSLAPAGSLEAAAAAGLITDTRAGIHPLLREFLLSKLTVDSDSHQRVRDAIQDALDHGEWTSAFELIVRFRAFDLVDTAIASAYRPLVRNGQLWTLTDFVTSCISLHDFSSGATSLVLAASAWADGAFDLSRQFAERAVRQLPDGSSLRPVAALAVARSALVGGDVRLAKESYADASSFATDDRDLGEALFTLANQVTFLEVEDPTPYLEALRARRDRSSLDLVRYGIAVTNATPHL